jgi:hypothetical protein
MFKIKEEEKQRQIREANEVFEKILRISSKTKEEIYYVPRNLNEQKKLFLENKILNPKFKYLKTPYNPNREIERLKKIKVNRKNKFYKFLKEIIEEKILNLENTKNLGDSNKRLKISLQKYGKTKKRLVKKAKRDYFSHLRKKETLPTSQTILERIKSASEGSADWNTVQNLAYKNYLETGETNQDKNWEIAQEKLAKSYNRVLERIGQIHTPTANL